MCTDHLRNLQPVVTIIDYINDIFVLLYIFYKTIYENMYLKWCAFC